ncbi:glycosyltransferase family 4 protein [Roseicyclus persicicus]|uniref:Glycosyltransferase family 4 protein n=1 Tax=Roseicyclus persicicus TaxID=2650661 RepID=A0A7X6JZM3_9RHOB|nr:glycosyltransferase family 4 protein [Roseibacterium persicicum]NKX45325.1 glycosyltransferase family 4 protein [Roseibacterium persicicum]
MQFLDPAHVDVLAPNFKSRLSGVTATVVRLVPLQSRDIAIAAVAPALPTHVPQVRLRDLVTMPRHGPSGARVWHARRNSEMLAGIVLKRVLRKDLKLLFTSASQRTHTRYTKWLIGQMDAVISTSRKTAGYLDRPSTVILHGIDLTAFSTTPDRARLKARMGLPAGPLVGCFGRIRAQKGTGDFVEAMIAVLRDFPEVTAIVMGRATEQHRAYERSLRERVLAAGLENRILFKPEVPVHEIADWYRALDLFVAPQRWEGFGLTPLEAMACGVPVVATRVGAFEELVVDGRTGALIPPQDGPAMAAAVRAYLENPAERMLQGEAARAHMEARFDIAREAAAISAIYRELLAR